MTAHMHLHFANPGRWNALVVRFYANALDLEETRELKALVNRELRAREGTRPTGGFPTGEARYLRLLYAALDGLQVILEDEAAVAS